MPRDNKSPLIQKIARKAHVAFKDLELAANGVNDVDKHTELVSLVTAIRAADLKLTHPSSNPSSAASAGLQSPPVSYMHICETEGFSMGVFLLKSGASIPLHDHPGMNGMLKVLYGKVSVCSYDKLDDNLSVCPIPSQFEPPIAPFQTVSLRRTVFRSSAEYTENSGPCLLTPAQDNLHQINAVEGPAAFLDILAPPYNADHGRDCNYYRILQTVEEGKTDEQQGDEEEKEKVTWMLEIPEPEDFWCGPEPYPGPAVS
ncbi:unnamed protein product, partial [Tetraodon nigroviridis]